MIQFFYLIFQYSEKGKLYTKIQKEKKEKLQREKEFRDKLKIFYELLEMRKIITFDNFIICMKDI